MDSTSETKSVADSSESLKVMKTVIDMISTPVLIVDVMPDGRFVWRSLNQTAEQYFEEQNEKLVGRDLDDFENENEAKISNRKRAIERLKLCVAAKEPLIFESEYSQLTTDRYWGRTTYAPTLDAEGEVRQVTITVLDITELVQTHNRLEDALAKTLSGFVTICASCKNIRDKDEWQPIEQYASKQMDYHDFSHGICPRCTRKLLDSDDGIKNDGGAE